MPGEDSVTHWIGRLKAGDAQAAQELWERYFQRLVGLARKKLGRTPRQIADEEDVALSAFDSFCRGAERGRFTELRDRDNLWPLLVLITSRKVADQVQHLRRQKRGAGMVQVLVLLGEVLGREPTPAFAVQVAEEYQHLLALLGDAELQAIARYKIEGYTNEEIATELNCTARTVERKLRSIRGLWRQQLDLPA
jgi:DNA-directed RNA polymerase specialized sigma24 family protein